jgi:hypothetical protein
MDPLIELTDAAKARIKTKEAKAAEQHDIVRRACEADVARAHEMWGGYFDLHQSELRDAFDQARLTLEEAASLCGQYVFSAHATEYSTALSFPSELRPILAKLREAVVKQYGAIARPSIQHIEAAEIEKAEQRSSRRAAMTERDIGGGHQIGKSMNLTAQQKDLLIAIVDGHTASKGKPFIFVHHSSGRGLCYEGGHSAWVDADHSDFVQLQRENLINFTQLQWPSLTGKPTQFGIDAAATLRSNPATGGPIRPSVPDIAGEQTDFTVASTIGSAPETDEAERAEPHEVETAAASVGVTTPAPRQRRHGFEPDMELHRRIVAVVERHEPNWKSSNRWRDAGTLEGISDDLDKDEIEVPESWSQGKPQALDGAPVKRWREALDLAKTGKKFVADQIRTSLDAILRQEKGQVFPKSPQRH